MPGGVSAGGAHACLYALRGTATAIDRRGAAYAQISLRIALTEPPVHYLHMRC